MKPAKDRDIAQSDPGELEAIQAAIRAGRPTYWIQTTDGCTLDVVTDEATAMKRWQLTTEHTKLGYHGVKLMRRDGSGFSTYEPPKQVQ